MGVGCVRPPDTYKNHDKVPVTFSLVDEWASKHSEKLQMQMSRYPARAEVYKRTTRRLFSGPPDVIAPRSLISPPRQISKKEAAARRRAFVEMVSANLKREHAKVLIGSETG